MYEQTLKDPSNLSKCVVVVRKGFWFHVDGALGAAYMPFLEMAFKNGLTGIESASVFDFRLDFVSSIVTSVTSIYIGTLWPCGVYLTRNSLLCPDNDICVMGSSDTTISLSCNSHSSILLWSFISSNPYDKQVADILQCQKLVQYTVGKLQELQKLIGLDQMITIFPHSLSCSKSQILPLC